MRIRNLFLIVSLAASIIFAQDYPKALFYEANAIPADSGYKVFFSYRIPYKTIVFVKKDSFYQGVFSVNLEIRDADDKIISRQSRTDTIAVDKYDETNSATDNKQGFLTFSLPPGNYKILPNIEMSNTNISTNLEPLNLKLENEDSVKVFSPIVVEVNGISCTNKIGFWLSNYSGSIPFSTKQSSLLVPVTDPDLDSIRIDFLQNDSTLIVSRTVTTKIKDAFSLNECG